MVRSARIVLLLIALAAIAPTTRAQTSDATAPGAPPLLLPKPAIPIGSSGPPTPTFAPVNLPGPYFEPDALLDRPPLPPPGWFADVDIGGVIPHVKNHLQEQVSLPGDSTAKVALPSAGLDGTVFPRVEAGYRLPSGFGAFSLSYRGLSTDGNGSAFVLDEPASLHSRLDLNEIGCDYSNSETSLWPNWDMKWTIGVRMLWVYFDSLADNTLGQQHESNWYAGFGPHVGLELDRQIEHSGLSFVLRGETNFYLGRLHQNFFDESMGTSGDTRDRVSQGVPGVSVFAGVRWQPTLWPNAEFYLGYQYEHWWDIGKNNDTLSSAELDVQGIFVRAGWIF